MDINFDDWGFWGFVVGVIALIYSRSDNVLNNISYHAGQIHDDPHFRREQADKLRNAGLGNAYTSALQTALDTLDRFFGPPGSAKALESCILVAVAYAYAFFLSVGCSEAPAASAASRFCPKTPRKRRGWFGGLRASYCRCSVFSYRAG